MLSIIVVWCVAFLAGCVIWAQIEGGDDWMVFVILFHVVIMIGAIGAAIYANS